LYSGIENSSGSYLSNNNLNRYQPDMDLTPSRTSQQQYQSNNLTNRRTQDSSYESLDQIKAKLDELSKSIDSHLQSNNNNSGSNDTMRASTNTGSQYSQFQSYSRTNFENYFNTAQQQLLRGNYNEAADSFTLASVYEPQNPYCYAGQGHAMFAAGQFVSSALYIIRAIELNPEYIQTNIDLAAVTGSRDNIYLRTNELEQLLKKAPASGLQILAAYVYYRTGQLMNAREIINAVYQETPNSRAAVALKIAIDSKINHSR
jgi:tetratricopeptide (TPR) repeat protein